MSSGETSVEPVDPDVDTHDRTQRGELWRNPTLVLLTVAAGGALGAMARYGLGELLVTSHWPWPTWVVNVSGSVLIGVVLALVAELWSGQRLLRPFLGVGVLGGYTTFSTATLEVQQLMQHGRPGVGLLYLAGTVLAAFVAVAAGALGTTALLVRRRPGKGRRR